MCEQRAKGDAPTLAVAAIGQSLASLEDIAMPEHLIDKLRRRRKFRPLSLNFEQFTCCDRASCVVSSWSHP